MGRILFLPALLISSGLYSAQLDIKNTKPNITKKAYLNIATSHHGILFAN
jgi:hypothetical protein